MLDEVSTSRNCQLVSLKIFLYMVIICLELNYPGVGWRWGFGGVEENRCCDICVVEEVGGGVAGKEE